MIKRTAWGIALCSMTITLAGCGALIPLALFGGAFGDIGDSFDAFEAVFDELDAQIEATPFVEVRLVNNSDVTAEVKLVSGIEGPDPSEFINADFGFFSYCGNDD